MAISMRFSECLCIMSPWIHLHTLSVRLCELGSLAQTATTQLEFMSIVIYKAIVECAIWRMDICGDGGGQQERDEIRRSKHRNNANARMQLENYIYLYKFIENAYSYEL